MPSHGASVTDAMSDVFAPARVVSERCDDGVLLLRAQADLGAYEPSVVHAFRHGSELHPDRTLAAQRRGDRWQGLTWGQARRDADALAQRFLDLELGPERPVMVLSGNSLEHLVVMLGAYTAGVPVLPISPSYSLLSRTHTRICDMARQCQPGLVFADDGDAFGAALDAVAETTPVQVLINTGSRTDALALADVLASTPTEAVEVAVGQLGPDTVAKVLFTSGSTGAPKGVITTHRMLCSSQQALRQVWPFLRDEPPVLVDWLPWSHVFGGSHNLGQVIAFGGTLYIDEGKPVPGLFEPTVDALREVAPTIYYNVPAGYALLAPLLEADHGLATTFFSRLRFMFYAGAALPDELWLRLRGLGEQVTGRSIPLTASWGTTESAPAATSAHFASAVCGCIGVPLPGVKIKLVPSGNKLELRLAGPNVTPGYFKNPEASEAAFDEDGFYRTGDAGRLVDPDNADLGLMFDGRLAENFKLASGTWVHVGALRVALLSAAGGVLRDAVIAGADREYVTAMAWLDPGQAQTACGTDGPVRLDDPKLHTLLGDALAQLNAGAGAASAVRRLLLLEEPPQIDAGEITDKGYVNQRAVLERRADLLDELYVEPISPRLITAGGLLRRSPPSDPHDRRTESRQMKEQA